MRVAPMLARQLLAGIALLGMIAPQSSMASAGEAGVITDRGAAIEAQSLGAASVFDPAVTIAPRASVVSTGDVTGDGIDDIVIGGVVPSDPWGTTSEIRVYIGQEHGLPVSHVAYSTRHPETIDIGDVTGDGRADVVIGERYDEALQVFAQNTDGSLASPVAYPTSTWSTVQIGDVTGDGRLDVVSLAWTDVLEVRQQTASGTLGPPTSYSIGAQGYNDLELGDVTGDGRTDVVAMSGQGLAAHLLVLAQQPDGSLTLVTSSGLPDGDTAFGVGVGDVTGDGRQDVLMSNGRNAPSGRIYLFEQTEGGSLAPPILLPPSESPDGIEIADMDGNGYEDAVVSRRSWPLSVYFQSSSGGLGDEVLTGMPSAPLGTQNMELADLDHNGTMDVALARGTGGLVVLLNRTAPTAPTIETALGGNGQATVSWTAPASDGGSPITGYVVTPYVGYSPRSSQTFGSTATTQTLTGLTNGTTYRFRVRAINAVGISGYSTVTNPVTPAAPTVPGAPTIGTAVAGDGQAQVSWTAPSSDGGSPITGYVVTPYIGYFPLPSRTFNSQATTQVITGLTNGKTYRFRVRATNAVGTGPYSTVTNPVTPTA